jgi:hypothetical protein
MKLKFGVKLGAESREEIYEMEAKEASDFAALDQCAQDDYINDLYREFLWDQIEPMIEQADGSSAFRREKKGELWICPVG